MIESTLPDGGILQAEVVRLRQSLAYLDDMAAQGLPVDEARTAARARLGALEAHIATHGDRATRAGGAPLRSASSA